MTTQPEADLRAQVKTALATAHISQAEAARRLGLSTKHMSQMLTGRATLTLDWADRILTLCGMTLAVVAVPATNRAHPAQPRIPLDDLTSDALDALYDRADRLHCSRNRWAAHAGRLQDRTLAAEARVRELEANVQTLQDALGAVTGQCRAAEHHARQAEATVARVRRAVDAGPVGICCAHIIRAALTPPTAAHGEGAAST
ncbi:helix-turn-helix transcriptional regulator [Streptomyces sp. DH8]|uniref:helix-turn-helix domain-containing protein n=1 Tax=Streptomyces sp. DH8 TaxID=2857008 RepID=UPI001E5260FF|nr:helix-turn-helix transcriptional regulator [Streptomyces sp. DH8]